MREFTHRPIDISAYSPTEDYYKFGNGVYVEAKVGEKVIAERAEMRGKRMIHALSFSTAFHSGGIDLVQVHFTPTLSSNVKVNHPSMFTNTDEKLPIALDCLDGFLSMAYAFNACSIEISGHDPDDALYLFAETNKWFAAFLRMRLGFRGTVAGNKAWTTQSDFTSDENMKYIHSQYAVLQNRIVY